MQTLLRVFSELNKEYARVGGELECIFCLSVPHDPVRFCGRPACRRLVCRACVETFLRSDAFQKTKQCFWCREKNPPAAVQEERDLISVATGEHKERRLQAAASRVMEAYIFDICFFQNSSGASKPLPLDLLRELVGLLAPKRDEDEENSPAMPSSPSSSTSSSIDVVPSGAARVALLRTLLAISDAAGKQAVDEALTAVMERAVQRTGYLDAPVGALCMRAYS